MLRVQADNLDQPFDINSGMKLDLGSTAKLRTLAHYLEVMESLHAELAPLDPEALIGAPPRPATAIPSPRWAAETLRKTPGLTLDASPRPGARPHLSRRSVGNVLHGGGVHNFENFDPEDNRRIFPCTRRSRIRPTSCSSGSCAISCASTRRGYPMTPGPCWRTLEHLERRRMLEEMADKDGAAAPRARLREYQGLESSAVLKKLLGERVHSPRHVAVVFFAWHPGGDASTLEQWSDAQGFPVPAEDLPKLVRTYGNRKINLLDYGRLLGRHPLEVWSAGEMSRTPALGWDG